MEEGSKPSLEKIYLDQIMNPELKIEAAITFRPTRRHVLDSTPSIFISIIKENTKDEVL